MKGKCWKFSWEKEEIKEVKEGNKQKINRCYQFLYNVFMLSA